MVKSFVIKNEIKEPPKPTKITDVQRSTDYIPFGIGNKFPSELMGFLRAAKVQRGVSLSKARHFTGAYFVSQNQTYLDFEKTAGITGESLFSIHRKLNIDKRFSGNAYLLIFTDAKGRFLKLQHVDWTKCRVNKQFDIIINPDWSNRRKENDLQVPLFPNFVAYESGYVSAYHFKEYEPEYTYYGIPDWIAGYINMQVDIKSDSWNADHLDKGLKPDIIHNLPAGTTDAEIEQIKQNTKDFKEGKPGSVMFTFGDAVKTTVLGEKIMDMDWGKLTEMNIEKTLIANQWYKSLMSVSQSTGFDTQRVQYEYQLALGDILKEQELFLDVYKRIFTTFMLKFDDVMIYNSPIIPKKSTEARLLEMLPFFSDAQKAEIGTKYFNALFNEEIQ